jgi:hypothetical protein
MTQLYKFRKAFSDNISSLALWGHFFMLLLVFLSIYFYAERVLYYDSAYQFFKIINSESYNIEADRWSAVIVQTLPLLAIKLALPLKAVLIIYSFSYILIGYIIFIINIHFLKNIAAGIAVVFLYTVCIRDSFFYCVTELPVGMLFTTLLYAWLFFPIKTGKYIHPAIYIFIALLIILICFFFHPMTFFPVIFIIGYYLLRTRNYKEPRIITLLFFTVMLYAAKTLFTSSSSYEGNLFGQLKSAPALIQNILSLDSTAFFIDRSLSLYLIINIFVVLIAAFYILKKEWLLLCWFFLNLAGFLLICFVAFNKGDSHIAMEKYFMPLSLLIAVPFLHDIISIKKGRLIGLLLCLFIFSRGIHGIYSARTYFTQHLEYIDKLIDVADTRSTSKLLVFKENVDQNYTTWACATETLLRSASSEKKSQSTIYLIHKNEIDQIDLISSTLFLCVPFDQNSNISILNKRYFSLPLEPYVIYGKPIH